MARATRSKNTSIDISEDQTASPISSDQLQAFLSRGDHLAELPNVNPMARTQDTLTAELKGLKAAYRTAIGDSRKNPKRGRKQNKNQSDSGVDGSEGVQKEDKGANAQQELISVSGAAQSMQEIREEGPQGFELPIEQCPAPQRRTTRRQAAKEQAAERALSKSTTVDRNIIGDSFLAGALREASANEYSTAKEDMAAKEGLISEMRATRAHTPAPLSPAKLPVKTLADIERTISPVKLDATLDDEDDSFVDQIIARSPAKPVSRIEDSVEALDQLEEALEALDEAALAETMVSPEKTRQKPCRDFTKHVESTGTKEKRKAAERKPLQEDTFRSPSTRSQSANPGYSSMRVKPTVARAPSIKKATSMVFGSQSPIETSSRDRSPPQTKPRVNAGRRPLSMIVKSTENAEKPQIEATVKAPSRRPISLLPPREAVRSTKPVTKASFELPGEAISRRIKEQREARQARKEASEESAPVSRAVSGPQVKSTKPLTVSNFELPGEAISRRKKEALEARLRAEEEEERQRREFKARPLHKSVVPNVAPREKATNRARQSQTSLENITENGTSKRNSIMNVGAHRPSLAQANAANVSAPRAPGPAPTLTRKPSMTSASGLNMSGKVMQRTVSATEVQAQRQRAREAYNRDAKLTEEIEKERREREAAAKRAREEAAERGRQASREWAEKQLAKKLADGDKGMSGGYGIGGQLGLRA